MFFGLFPLPDQPLVLDLIVWFDRGHSRTGSATQNVKDAECTGAVNVYTHNGKGCHK